MRERGSSTARPTEKGVGGLPIRSIRSISARRFGRFRRVDSVVSVDFGASIRSCRSISARRFGRFRRASCRFGRVLSRFGVLLVSRFGRFRRVGRVEVKAQTQKKARFLNRGIGFSYRKASRALNIRLVPLSNTRASARGVRLGLACRVDLECCLCRVASIRSIRSSVLSISARRFGRFRRVVSVDSVASVAIRELPLGVSS